MSTQGGSAVGERIHIGIFGKRNAGKSSLLNAIAGQDAAVVSAVPGTTTDPVYKTMELLPAGPVVLIDTPGFDDVGELGALRVEKVKKVLLKTEAAVLVADIRKGLGDEEIELSRIFEQMGVKYITVYSKADLAEKALPGGLCVSAATGENINELKEKLAEICAAGEKPSRLAADLLKPGDIVLLVTPIDEAAPKGRLILPQQQVIRNVLEADAVPVLTQPMGIKDIMNRLKVPPALVITDSQVFAQAAGDTPEGIALTSFSILMARYKGVLEQAVKGAGSLDFLKEGDRILISEGCTHHRQCNDIGSVKLPKWIEKHTGVKPVYEFSSGGGFPEDLSDFRLIIHCGGCMLNGREMKNRCKAAEEDGIPMTNYGIAISHMQGILERCIRPFTFPAAQAARERA